MKLDILAFAAHPDDVELSCSGTLMRHVDQGKRVGIIDLTAGELGSRGSAQLRLQEVEVASEIMGVAVRENLFFRDGYFDNDEEHRLRIIECIRKYRPEIVLANAPSDRHPDHGRAAKLVSDAAFYSGLNKIVTEINGVQQEAYRPRVVYHYIQDRLLTPDFVVDVTPYVSRKIEAIKAFKTQFYDPQSTEPETPISGEHFFNFLKGRMTDLGRDAGFDYAEGFVKSRMLGVVDLFELK